MTRAEAFREGMRCLASAVTVVSVDDGERRGGLTASAVTSLTLDPPSLLACVNREARSHQLIVGAGRFAVNVLSTEQEDVARTFAGLTGLDGEERFTVGEWRVGDRDQPLLVGALAVFECVVDSLVARSTHDIVIGEVRSVHLGDGGAPLLYLDRSFRRLA